MKFYNSEISSYLNYKNRFKYKIIFLEEMFDSKINLKFRDEKTEVDFQKMKESKFFIFNKWIVLFSFISAVAVAILQSTNFDRKFEEYVFFKFNIMMNFIAIFIYFIFLFFAFFSKNLTVLRWIHYILFYFQIFVIMGFRFEIFKKLNSTSTLIFFQYLIEMFVRLVWVILYLQSFLESLVLNSLVILTVWLTIPFMYPTENFQDEMINSLAYSCVLFMVIVIAYIIEIQQKKAFYFLWQADSKAKWLTSILDNLNSGFVSIKNGKIKYINSFFINHLDKLKHTSKYTEDVKEVKSDIFSTRREG
jgi:hypothetical protein